MKLQDLRDIQTKLATPPASNLPELDGIFYRVEDFTLSHGRLLIQFRDEYSIATFAFPDAKDAESLMNEISKKHDKMQVRSLGKDHFTSRELSPALRHFVNDSCRLLEPTTPILTAKFSDVSIGPRESLNSAISKLKNAGKTLAFDAQYIIELYELWNDYKHRETTGAHATPWKYETNLVIKAKLGLPRLNVNITKLNHLDVDSFVYQTDAKILEFLNFVL